MDITRRRAWRACGWAAAGLYVCIAVIIIGITIEPHAPAALSTTAICATPGATLLAAVRLIGPPLGRINQKLDLKQNLSEHVTRATRTGDRRDAPVLRLVQPVPPADPQSGAGFTYEPQHKRRAVSE